MGNKVELTQIQANAIDCIKKKYSAHEEDIIRDQAHGHNGWADKLIGLKDMPLLTLVDALRVGYAVKHELGVGDIVKLVNGGNLGTSKHGEVQSLCADEVYLNNHGWISIERLKCVTPEEAAIEKERMMWLDIETGDVLIHKISRRLCRFIDQDSLDKIMIQVSWDLGAIAFAPRSNFELYTKKVQSND